jgi:hypothetical protein
MVFCNLFSHNNLPSSHTVHHGVFSDRVVYLDPPGIVSPQNRLYALCKMFYYKYLHGVSSGNVSNRVYLVLGTLYMVYSVFFTGFGGGGW